MKRFAVAAAVEVLEDCPHFNAGKGAVSTNEGTIELDASIMDGRDRRAGAEQFAREQGLATVDPSHFRAPKRPGPGKLGTVGAGTWAENGSVAVSATGAGEMFLRGATAHDIAALVKYRGFAKDAAKPVVLI